MPSDVPFSREKFEIKVGNFFFFLHKSFDKNIKDVQNITFVRIFYHAKILKFQIINIWKSLPVRKNKYIYCPPGKVANNNNKKLMQVFLKKVSKSEKKKTKQKTACFIQYIFCLQQNTFQFTYFRGSNSCLRQLKVKGRQLE